MTRWTASAGFQSLTVIVLTAFFWVFGVDLAIYASVRSAEAASIDDLLKEDDSDLLGPSPAKDTKAVEKAKPAPKVEKDEYEDEDEEEDEAPKAAAKPEPKAEPAKKAEPVKEAPKAAAKPAADDEDEDEDEDEEEDEAPAKPPVKAAEPAKKPEPVKEAPKATAKPAVDDEDEDEDEDEAAPAKDSGMFADEAKPEPAKKQPRYNQAVTYAPRVDGPTKVISFVFPANANAKRRAAEVESITRGYFRGSAKTTFVPLNYALGDRVGVNERAQSQKAEAALKEGMKAYNNVELNDAIESFEQAIQLYGPLLEYPEHRAKAEEATLYLAASYVLNGDGKDGEKTFVRLLKLNPSLSLDGKGFTPAVFDIYAKAKGELEDAPSGSVNVTSDPDGMAVYMDGYFRGLAPVSLEGLSVGEHFLKVIEPGYQDYSTKLTIYPDTTKKLSVKLKQIQKFYTYKSELDTVENNFAHKKMWKEVQNLSKVTATETLYFCKVAEKGGMVSLEAYLYDLAHTRHKTQTVELEIASDRLDAAVFALIDRILSNDVEWQDSYVSPADMEEAAAVSSAEPVTKTWWFWTIIGVVAAGAVAGAGVGIWYGTKGSGGNDSGTNPKDFKNPNAILVRW